MQKNVRYGWRPDTPDFRDYKFAVPRHLVPALPSRVDLRETWKCEIFNQGELGSCTANAIAAAHRFEQKKQDKAKMFDPSRLFIYYNERDMEGTINLDAGAEIRDGMKSVAKQGVCPETDWPYDISQFTTKPSDACYVEALRHQVVQYMRIDSPSDQLLDQLKACLAAGYPFVFGFTVYSSFESVEVAQTGQMVMPQPGDNCLGGHAVMAIGYVDATEHIIVQNSWGDMWGQNGYFYMPYKYIINPNLASDFWTIRLVEVDDVTPVPDPTPLPEPPKPTPCDWSLLFPAAQAFVDSAVAHADEVRTGSSVGPSSDRMLEAGLRGIQGYMRRVSTVRAGKG